MIKKQTKKKQAIGFGDLNNKLDQVIDTMATKEDIVRLDGRIDQVIDTMATKEDLLRLEMATKQNLDVLDEKFSKKFHEILIATEGLMKPISELKMEYTGMMIQLSRHETWIKLLAEKQGVTLPIQ
jgi:hypothetical protein